jgi:hypothetical protein
MKNENELRMEALNLMNATFDEMTKLDPDWNDQDNLVITNETIDDILETRDNFWNEIGHAIRNDNTLEIQRAQVLKGQMRYNHYIIELEDKCFCNSEIA